MGNIRVQFQKASQQKRMTVKQILAPCSSLTASRWLHSTTLLCPFSKGSSQCSCRFRCRGSNCLGELTVSCTGSTTLSKWGSSEWQIKTKHTRTTHSLRETLPFTYLIQKLLICTFVFLNTLHLQLGTPSHLHSPNMTSHPRKNTEGCLL